MQQLTAGSLIGVLASGLLAFSSGNVVVAHHTGRKIAAGVGAAAVAHHIHKKHKLQKQQQQQQQHQQHTAPQH